MVTYSFDTAITAAGSTGIRSLKDNVLDEFSTGPIVLATPSSFPFTDAFTQDSGTQLAREWTERQGNFNVSNNRLVANAASVSLATINGVSLGDVAVQADIAVGANQVAGLITRYQANGNYYLAQVNSNSTGTAFTANIYKCVAGTLTRLNATPALLASGTGALRFEVVGTSLKLYFGADAASLTLAVNVVDSTLTAAGLVGIRANKNATLDTFTFE